MQRKQGNVKVFCRFRPFNRKQLQCHSQKLHRIANKTQLIIKDIKGQKHEGMSFMYDHAFDMDSTQQQVFQQVGFPVLKNILDGFNGTIMAYGQTSSGKTHTMQGYDITDKDAKGIMPRIIQKLFTAIQKSTQSIEYKLKISIFQLYMQKIRDLLDVSKNDLKIRQNKAGPYVQNLTQVYVGDKAQLFKLIHMGQKNRITCATNMNEHSSRSHMIFLLSLNQFNNQDSSSKTSKLFLIDLAGSQKVGKTGAEGKVLEEAKKINLSLTNLGKVIKHLADKNSHVPYRDSKLTRVLKDSLGGNSKTTLIVTCSPHEIHLPQTISTLRFGQNAQKIKNKPKINRQLTVQQLQKIIEKLLSQATAKELKIQFLQKYIQQKLNAQLPNYKEISILVRQINSIQQEAQEGKVSFKIQDNKQRDQDEQQQIEQLSERIICNNLMPGKQVGKAQKTSHIQQQSYYVSRVAQVQEQLCHLNLNMSRQTEKYYQLKRQYNELHENLTSILKENIELQQEKGRIERQKQQIQHKLLGLEYAHAMKEQAKQSNKLEEKTDEESEQSSLYQNWLENKLIVNNSPLIKMIIGEIFSIIGPYQENQIVKVIENDHWYRQIMVDGVNCVDYFEYEKQKIYEQMEQFVKKREILDKYLEQGEDSKQRLKMSDSKNFALLQQSRLQKQKQNKKVISLQTKLDRLFDEYHQMISLQTTWKAECQLYERKLKKKQEKIQELQQMLHQLSEQIQYLQGNNYDDFDDTGSVKSKIIKPIKGGFLFK